MRPKRSRESMRRTTLLEVSAEITATGVVLTNRLHGALLALLHERPAIAIDQVVGGGKVSAVLRRVDYPCLFAVDHLDDARLGDAYAACRQPARHCWPRNQAKTRVQSQSSGRESRR